MSEITCPHCAHDHDSGDYPDHGAGDELDCTQCGTKIRISLVEWDPVYYTERAT